MWIGADISPARHVVGWLVPDAFHQFSPLEGDTENALGSLDVIGMLSADVTEECMDSGKPDIARGHAVGCHAAGQAAPECS